MHVPYPTTCSLSSFEKMMMAVKIDAPAGWPDLVQESTPITAVNPSGQEHRQKKESSWFNFISHMEEPTAPSSRRQEQQRQPKPAPVDSAHYAYLMAGNSREEHESDADVHTCSNLCSRGPLRIYDIVIESPPCIYPTAAR